MPVLSPVLQSVLSPIMWGAGSFVRRLSSFDPLNLNLYLALDARQGVLKAGGSAAGYLDLAPTLTNLATGSNAGSNATQGTSGSQPVYLEHTAGANYLHCPGIDNNGATVPDSAALDVATPLDLRVLMRMTDWTPAQTYNAICDKGYSYSIFFEGPLLYFQSGTGTGWNTHVGGVSVGESDGALIWVRVVYSAGVATFYKSTDGANWTIIGSSGGYATSAPLAGTEGFFIGQNRVGGSALRGAIHRVRIFASTNGTDERLDVNFAAVPHRATSFVCATGQCVWEKDFITLASGKQVKAADLVGKEFEIFGWNENTKQTTKRKAWANWNEVEEVFCLTTESGRKIYRNGQHPIWTGVLKKNSTVKNENGKWTTRNAIIDEGWAHLRDLNPAEHAVLVPIKVDTEASDRISFEEAAVMGYLMGDGTFSQRSVKFYQMAGEQLNEFISCVESLGCNWRTEDSKSEKLNHICIRRQGEQGFTQIGDISKLSESQRQCVEAILSGQSQKSYAEQLNLSPQAVNNTLRRAVEKGVLKKNQENKTHPIADLLDKWGLRGKIHTEMSWPEQVWTLHPEDLAVVIGRFWACDGWASMKTDGGQGEIGICQHNEEIIRGLQKLLLRLGIGSTIYQRTTTHKDRFTLVVNPASHSDFASQIYIPGKQDRIDKISERNSNYSDWRKRLAPKGYRWEMIKKVGVLDGLHQTVAIEIEEDHAWSDLIVEHNTVTINATGNNPATVIGTPVLRFDGSDDFLSGTFASALTGGRMFAVFSVLGNGGGVNARVFTTASPAGNDAADADALIWSQRDSTGSNLVTYKGFGNRLTHTGAYSGRLLHEVLSNGALLSRVNNAVEKTSAYDTSELASNIFAIANGVGNNAYGAIDLEALYLLPADLSAGDVAKMRVWLNDNFNLGLTLP